MVIFGGQWASASRISIRVGGDSSPGTYSERVLQVPGVILAAQLQPELAAPASSFAARTGSAAG